MLTKLGEVRVPAGTSGPARLIKRRLSFSKNVLFFLTKQCCNILGEETWRSVVYILDAECEKEPLPILSCVSGQPEVPGVSALNIIFYLSHQSRVQ